MIAQKGVPGPAGWFVLVGTSAVYSAAQVQLLLGVQRRQGERQQKHQQQEDQRSQLLRIS